ncbi:MAG: protein-disulfide reductase DsbD [Gammaproteobacteria bacterium]
MKRLFTIGFLAALALSAALVRPVVAGQFLPPDQAFHLDARAAPAAILLDWHIADGYYLYEDRFKITAERGAIGPLAFPPGEVEDDPNFGRVTIYRGGVRLRLPVTTVPPDGRVALAVTYQGCADAGLCYAPITRHVSLMMPVVAAPVLGSSSGGASVTGSSASEQGRLAGLIEHANPVWFVLVFFALGVLLAFTPCVLPMVPILAGVLGGSRGVGTRRGFALSLVYVLAMAAVYTAAGVAAGFAGTGLQGFFQSPWVIALFAAVFVALALSLFGWYELRLPAALTDRLTRMSGRERGGGWLGAAFMGALSALIVSPCVAAPLAGALVVIGQGGEPVRGGIALAALALGMGAPLVVYGTVAGRLLPKAGGWMTLIERLLGVAMLAYAVWLLGRVIPAPVTLVLWGLIGLVAALFLGLFKRLDPAAVGTRRLSRGAGLVAGVCGLILIVGGAAGSGNPLAPFAGFRAPTAAPVWRSVTSLADLQRQLKDAAAAGQPAMLDVYADWCTSCLDMERTTFRAPAVAAALRQMRVLRADVTANTPAERALLKRFGLYGPPAYLFFDRCGRRLPAQDVVGYLNAEHFLAHVRAALAQTSTGALACTSAAGQVGATGT